MSDSRESDAIPTNQTGPSCSSMEALTSSSSIFASQSSEPYSAVRQTPPHRSSSTSSSSFIRRRSPPYIIKHCKSLRISTSNGNRRLKNGVRVNALCRKVNGDGEEDKTGFRFEDGVTLHQGNLKPKPKVEKSIDGVLDVDAHFAVSNMTGMTGGTRAGLFRTPISGGVQSATSAHGLPRPALAVRNLMEQVRFAHLCTTMSRMHHRREGYPFGSLVDYAPDSLGHPIFSFSPLAIHTRNLLADPRCSLVVQIPGWSGLSNARVTIFGDVFPLPEHQQEWAHQQYIAKHHQGPSQQWGNFYYFRMQNISDIYFIGGFGTVAWVNVKEYEATQPDKIAVDGGEQNLKVLNAMFSKPLKELLATEIEVDDAALISIDSKGTDVRVRHGAQFNVQRLAFEEGLSVETLEEAKDALWKLLNKGKVFNLQT